MKLQLQSMTVYGNHCPAEFCQSHYIDDTWWSIVIKIKFTKKGETKTTFWVEPPLWISNKIKAQHRFKTTSYKELCKWLEKHKKEINELK